MSKWIFTVCTLLLLSCNTSQFQTISPVGSNQNPINPKDKFIFFVHSSNQINGRITMDNLVRLSSHASVQGYLYTQGNRLLMSNWDNYQQKLLQENYQYAIIMYVRPSNQDAKNPQGNAFMNDYMLFIDPCFFNPTCLEIPEKFNIECKLYTLVNGNCIWECSSKTFENADVHQSFQEFAPLVIKQLKRQGYMRK